ncbi:DUF4296 domain-containing protein [uncultured Polaribacter sp.]|uniref:DUF4296 domain-containing protein n=1 Tax=uncultured Polaribacter sp. TaxID=174711 RepID=UPI00261389D5|nr:DUF4296 domain-containing protein [uncultured Polaribacter sp.]
MKLQTTLLLALILLVSCTSNTIFEEPKDLIPKDTMSLLLQEMMVATSAKFIKNKNLQKDINYMAFVFEKYKIDSTRFEISNYYYMSKIDLYKEILQKTKDELNLKNDGFKVKQQIRDSIKTDSIEKVRLAKEKVDSLKIKLANKKDSIKNPLVSAAN